MLLFNMKLKFETLHKPATNSEIKNLLYNGAEEALQKSFRRNLEKVRDKLEGCDILIKVDFKNSNATFSGENISAEQIKIIKEALDQKK